MTETLDFKTLFNALPERYVVFAIDSPAFTMLAASEKYLEITNKTSSDVLGKSLFEVFPDTSERAKKTGKGELQESLENVIAKKEPDSTGVIRYDLADESGVLKKRFWQATHYPIFEKGEVVAILQSTADVTDLLQANERLKQANLKLEDAVATGMIGSWSWDVASDIVTGDKGLANLFGVSLEEVLQGVSLKLFTDSIYESDRSAVEKIITKTLKSGDVFEAEYRTIDSNGIVRWVIARGRVERDESGAPVQFPGVMIDITSRKNAEANLKSSEERLRFMADTMPQLVWITRPDGYHEYYNKQWYVYTGTTEGTTDGEGWNNLFHPDDRARAHEVWQTSLKTGEPYEIKYRLYHAPSDTYRWVIGRALPYRDENDEIMKWYGTCTDIDDSIQEIEKRKELEYQLQEEKKRLESRVAERTSQLKLTNEGLREEINKRRTVERQLRDSSIELERSNKELEEFAFVSSHDLQEPLRKIQAFSGLLVEEFSDKLAEGRDYLERIQSSASRMSTLIDDLLTFSRVTTKPSVTRPVRMDEVMDSIISDLQDRIKKEDGTVNVQSSLPVVMADATHMRQLFQNLISNALKFHAPGRKPVVELTAATEAGFHLFMVKDNGIGIDKKYQDKVFAVFQRLNAKQAYEGTGIGLSVCKKIVERYGGTIEIESQLGEGTTFTISLPVENEVTDERT